MDLNFLLPLEPNSSQALRFLHVPSRVQRGQKQKQCCRNYHISSERECELEARGDQTLSSALAKETSHSLLPRFRRALVILLFLLPTRQLVFSVASGAFISSLRTGPFILLLTLVFSYNHTTNEY